MVNVIKEPFNVTLNEPIYSCKSSVYDRKSGMTTAIWSKAVRSIGKTGKITLNVSSPGLTSTAIVLTAKK